MCHDGGLILINKKGLIMWEKGSKAADYLLLFWNNACAVWWLKNWAVPRAAELLSAATEVPKKYWPWRDQSLGPSDEAVVHHQMTQTTTEIWLTASQREVHWNETEKQWIYCSQACMYTTCQKFGHTCIFFIWNTFSTLLTYEWPMINHMIKTWHED